MLNIITHQGEANQNHNETLVHTQEGASAVVGRAAASHAAGGRRTGSCPGKEPGSSSARPTQSYYTAQQVLSERNENYIRPHKTRTRTSQQHHSYSQEVETTKF